MALSPPFVVRVEKKPESSFGAAMNDIRTWLDHRKIEPISFEPAAKADRAFHLAIARATQNAYYVRFADFLGLRLVPPRNLYLRDSPESAQIAYSAKVHAEHDAIVDAIIRMDTARAREAAHHHMQESLTRHSMLSATARVRDRS